jgi:endoglucanase
MKTAKLLLSLLLLSVFSSLSSTALAQQATGVFPGGRSYKAGYGGSRDACVQNSVLLGVNLSAAEFGSTHLPGVYNSNYSWPITQEYDYFLIDKKMRLIRIPFLWERIQPTMNGALATAELARLVNAVNQVTVRGGIAILDVHNYARYYGGIVGSDTVPNSAFADLWTKLTNQFATNPSVWFGLMNEPFGMATEQWRDAAQAAVTAIRAAETTAVVANHKILLPGNGFTGGHSWTSGTYGTANSEVMPTVIDPAGAGKMVYEIHQYADSDSSGTHTACTSATIFSQRLAAFTTWARSLGVQGFLGEVGIPNNSTCLSAEADLLKYMQENSDVYLGATFWSAGPWWGTYFQTLEPNFSTNPATSKPQVNLMDPYVCIDDSAVRIAPVDPTPVANGFSAVGRAITPHLGNGVYPGLLSPADYGIIHNGIPVVGLQTTASSRITYTSVGTSFAFSTNKLNVSSASIADGGLSLLVNFVADVGSSNYPCYADSAPPTTGSYIWYCYETTNTTLKLRATSRSNGSDVSLNALGNFGVSFYVGK